MTRRTDAEWADEVVRRWQRRRWKVQQRDKAMADLREAVAASTGLNRLVRWLDRILGGEQTP